MNFLSRWMQTYWLVIVLGSVTFAMRPVHAQDGFAWTVAQANNQFAFDLFAKLREGKSAEENILASPVSISTALVMAYTGARNETADEMANVLRLAGLGNNAHAGYGDWLAQLNTSRDEYQLSIVNRQFGQHGMPFKQPFLDTLASAYRAPLEAIDFSRAPEAARQRINRWVADQTYDRIQDLLPPTSIDGSTRLVLANALYLDAAWLHPFDKSLTQAKAFHRSDGSMKLTPTMTQTEQFRYGDFAGYSILEMPYEGEDLSMVIVLPDEIDGVADVEASLTAESLQGNIDSLGYRNLSVSLPLFRFHDRYELRDPLIELGMQQAFSAGADFSGLTDEVLSIDQVFHQTSIDVSERSTEASAATAVVFKRSAPPPPIPFTVDRPFLFAIRDMNTEGLLFLGRMSEPGLPVAVPEPKGFGMVIVNMLLLWVGRSSIRA